MPFYNCVKILKLDRRIKILNFAHFTVYVYGTNAHLHGKKLLDISHNMDIGNKEYLYYILSVLIYIANEWQSNVLIACYDIATYRDFK